MLKIASKCLFELACAFVVIQEFNLGIAYYGVSPSRDFDFTKEDPKYKTASFADYLRDVEIALKSIDGRYTLNSKVSRHKEMFNTVWNAVKNIPGKYLLLVFKNRLISGGLIYQTTDESFAYALSRNFELNEFCFLKVKITRYTQ